MTVTITDDRPSTLIDLIAMNVVQRVLLVVTNKDSLNANTERTLKSDLEAYFGAVVDVAESSTDIDLGSWDINRYDIIIVCNGVAPADVNDLKGVEVPVLSLDEDVSVTALNMASSGGASSETQMNLTDITHQIISEALRAIDPTSIAAGNKTVYSSSSNIDYLTTLGTGGSSIAEDTVTATEEHIVVYEEDTFLQDATRAEEIRIHFGAYQFNQLTPTGKALFREAVGYALFRATRVRVEVEMETEVLEEMLSTIGNYGIFPGMPTGEHERIVRYFKPTATGDGDGSSAADAAAAAYDCISTYLTANRGDVAFFLQGSFDINGAVGGLACSIAGCSIFGPGGSLATFVNSNAGATYIINITAANVEIAGMRSNEATNTVEFIYGDSNADYCHIHHNIADGAMENGIHFDSSTDCEIYLNNIKSCTNDGIEISGTGPTSHLIYENDIFGVGDNGIHLNGDDSDQISVHDNRINGNNGTTDYGITITLGDNNKVVDNWIGQCGTGHIFDSGSNNIWDNWVDEYSTTFTFTAAMATAKQTMISNYDCARPGKVSVKIDISTLYDAGEGGVSKWRVEEAGAGGDVYGFSSFIQGTDEAFPVMNNVPVNGGDSQFDVTGQLGTAATVNRIVTIYVYERGG